LKKISPDRKKQHAVSQDEKREKRVPDMTSWIRPLRNGDRKLLTVEKRGGGGGGEINNRAFSHKNGPASLSLERPDLELEQKTERDQKKGRCREKGSSRATGAGSPNSPPHTKEIC